MKVIFKSGDGGVRRAVGYCKTSYQSDSETKLVESSESELASIFEDAKTAGENLDNSQETMDDAINDPLSFLYHLKLDSSGTIVFNK